jgi:hypothetical protein
VARGQTSIVRWSTDPEGLPPESPLGRLHRHWKEQASAAGAVPPIGAITMSLLHRLGLDGLCHLVDVTADDPGSFRFIVWASNVRLNNSSDYTNLRLSEIRTSTAYREAAEADYNAAKLSGVPGAYRVEGRIPGVTREYLRLILPLAGPGGRVERLAIAIQYLDGSSHDGPIVEEDAADPGEVGLGKRA